MATRTNDTVEKLIALCQLDIDAIHAYEQALPHLDDAAARRALESFKGDHARHVADLSRVITALGGTPPDLTKDFKGFLIQGMTAVQSVVGTKGALLAMKTNEHLTNKAYAGAMSATLPPEAAQVVQRNYDDEKRHLAYIERALEGDTARDDVVENVVPRGAGFTSGIQPGVPM